LYEDRAKLQRQMTNLAKSGEVLKRRPPRLHPRLAVAGQKKVERQDSTAQPVRRRSISRAPAFQD
jgi:hypothetical protein